MAYVVDYSNDHQHVDGIEVFQYSGEGTPANVNVRRGSARRGDFSGDFGTAAEDLTLVVWHAPDVIIKKEETLTDASGAGYTIVDISMRRPDKVQTVVVGRLQP